MAEIIKTTKTELIYPVSALGAVRYFALRAKRTDGSWMNWSMFRRKVMDDNTEDSGGGNSGGGDSGGGNSGGGDSGGGNSGGGNSGGGNSGGGDSGGGNSGGGDSGGGNSGGGDSGGGNSGGGNSTPAWSTVITPSVTVSNMTHNITWPAVDINANLLMDYHIREISSGGSNSHYTEHTNIALAGSPGVLKKFKVQPRGTNGTWGGISNEVDSIIPNESGDVDTIPPSRPDKLTVFFQNGEHKLQWPASVSSDVVAYEICHWNARLSRPAETTINVGSNLNWNFSSNFNWSFKVRAIDAAGNKSEYSNTVVSVAASISQVTQPTISIVNQESLRFHWAQIEKAEKYILIYALDGTESSVDTTENYYQIDVTDLPNKPIHGFSSITAKVAAISGAQQGEFSEVATLTLIPSWSNRPTPTARLENGQLILSVTAADVASELVTNYSWSVIYGDLWMPDEWTIKPQLIIENPMMNTEYEFKVGVFGGFGGSAMSEIARSESNTARYRTQSSTAAEWVNRDLKILWNKENHQWEIIFPTARNHYTYVYDINGYFERESQKNRIVVMEYEVGGGNIQVTVWAKGHDGDAPKITGTGSPFAEGQVPAWSGAFAPIAVFEEETRSVSVTWRAPDKNADKVSKYLVKRVEKKTGYQSYEESIESHVAWNSIDENVSGSFSYQVQASFDGGTTEWSDEGLVEVPTPLIVPYWTTTMIPKISYADNEWMVTYEAANHGVLYKTAFGKDENASSGIMESQELRVSIPEHLARGATSMYAKVQAVSDVGTLGEWSEVGHSDFALGTPEAPQITIQHKGLLMISWPTVNGAVRYKLSIQLDDHHKNDYATATNYQLGATDVPSQTQSISVRISAIDASNNQGRFSDETTLNLTPRWPITPTPIARLEGNALIFEVPLPEPSKLISNYKWNYKVYDRIMPIIKTLAPQLVLSDPAGNTEYKALVSIVGGFGEDIDITSSNEGRYKTPILPPVQQENAKITINLPQVTRKYEIYWTQALGAETYDYQIIGKNGYNLINTTTSRSLSLESKLFGGGITVKITPKNSSGSGSTMTATYDVTGPKWLSENVIVQADYASSVWSIAWPIAQDELGQQAIYYLAGDLSWSGTARNHRMPFSQLSGSFSLQLYGETALGRTKTLNINQNISAPILSGNVLITTNESNGNWEISWPNVAYCTYRATISATSGSPIIRTLSINSTSVALSELKGTLSVSIVAINPFGRESATLTASKTASAPTWPVGTYKFDVYKLSTRNTWSVSWGGNPAADESQNAYRWHIEVSHGGRTITHISMSKVGSTEVPLHASQQDHRTASFRVRPEGFGGFGPWSPIYNVTLDELPPVVAPEISQISTNEDKISFSWNAVQYASAYTMSIRSGSNEVYWPRRQTASTSYSLTVGYDKIITVSVAGANSGGDGPYSTLPRTITTDYGRPHWPSSIKPTIAYYGSYFRISWPAANLATHYVVGFIYDGHDNNGGGITTNTYKDVIPVNPNTTWASAYVVPRIGSNGIQGTMSGIATWRK